MSMIRRAAAAAATFAAVGLGASALAVPGAAAAVPTTLAAAAAGAAEQVAGAEALVPAALRPHPSPGDTSVDADCFSTAYDHVDPQPDASGKPTNPAWWSRDRLNVMCANLRLRDQVTSPGYETGLATTGGGLWLQNLGQQQQAGVTHLHGGITSQIPGSLGTDPYRASAAWAQATGGEVLPVSFTSSDGAQLNGNLFLPPPGTPTLSNGRHPGVVITDGSVQAFQQMYFWAAEGLAQYGYEVLTYDVQGQGDSDLLPASCAPGACPGVPYQQNDNFYQGAEDALNFFLATPQHPSGGGFNPAYASLDPDHVGIAGHSLGASAVSWVAQCDRRVRAVVAWDDLLPIDPSKCAQNVTVPAADRASRLHAPALATANDYEFEPTLARGVPDPNGGPTRPTGPAAALPSPEGFIGGGGLAGDTGYLELKRAGIDTEIVSIRNGTHLIYSYIPYVLPADEIGERVAFHYTLAWFDRYLRGGADALLPRTDTAYQRLTGLGRFDQSADTNLNHLDPKAALVTIGAGTSAGGTNVPYRIAGLAIPGTLSFYYYSQYALHAGRALRECTDMLAGCPHVQPSTP